MSNYYYKMTYMSGLDEKLLLSGIRRGHFMGTKKFKGDFKDSIAFICCKYCHRKKAKKEGKCILYMKYVCIG